MHYTSLRLLEGVIFLSKNGLLVGAIPEFSLFLRNVTTIYTSYTLDLADGLDLNPFNDTVGSIHGEAWAGIILSHFMHLLSVLLLYKLTKVTFRQHSMVNKIAYISGCLHIITPAGLFLSAPYTESLFSCLHFSGYYLYSLVFREKVNGNWLKRDVFLILSGCIIGVAATIRSNGVLSGLLFAYDAVIESIQLLQHPASASQFHKLVITMFGGSLVAIGFLLPQSIAYVKYCSNDGNVIPRQWCSSLVPSIYSFVQSHYW